ncbi:MAG: cation transporter [Candidatus Omnitrophica bacterium]|nr:cation transporter [Candidatus Omnitrophota bacterium]
MSVIHHPHHTEKLNKVSRLRLAIILTGCGMLVEFAGGLLSRSLALLSDAGHMLTHLFALGMSYFAILLSLRPVTKKRTWGFYRAEVLAAFVNGFVLIFVALYLIYEALQRFINPRPIAILEMLVVALIGLAVNGISTFLLASMVKGDLNIRSAFFHELGDMASSIAIVASGLIIFYTKNYVVDPLVAVFICGLIVIWAIRLIAESANILLEATPRHLDIDELVRAIEDSIPEIHEMHHVHAWTIASSMYALTCHIVIEDCHVSKANEILDKVNGLLREKFHIGHTNIQFECLIKKP